MPHGPSTWEPQHSVRRSGLGGRSGSSGGPNRRLFGVRDGSGLRISVARVLLPGERLGRGPRAKLSIDWGEVMHMKLHGWKTVSGFLFTLAIAAVGGAGTGSELG